MEMYVCYHQMRTKNRGPGPVRCTKGKKMGSFFILAFKIWKKKLTGFDALTEIATLRTHRPSQSSRTEESPRASGSFLPPWYQAQSVNQTPSAKRTVAFFYPLSTDKMLKRYIPQSRGEVVVWALSPSGSDLIRPLPLQHSQEANTVGGVMAKTWFLILFVLLKKRRGKLKC